MANFMTIFLFQIMVFASSVKATDISSHNQNIQGAIEGMKEANYFTFVMLLKIAPPDLFSGNVTFLIPTDRMLAKAIIRQPAVVDFLLAHSIPSPLLFDSLIHFPTGSLLPTSSPHLMLNVTNDGRQSFFLNNVRIFSPNICTQGTSIVCLGIDRVLQPSELNIPLLSTPCLATNSSHSVVAAPTTTDHQGGIHPSVVSGAGKQKSGSHRLNFPDRLLQIIINVYLIGVSYIVCFT